MTCAFFLGPWCETRPICYLAVSIWYGVHEIQQIVVKESRIFDERIGKEPAGLKH